MSKYNVAGGGVYNLNASISSTDSSITLSSFAEPVTGTLYTMALLNTDIAYGTVAPRTTSSEFISFTGITQNADGTATLTGVTRGLAKKYPFTTDSAYKLPHSGQSVFILSDAPQVFTKYVNTDNDFTITGLWTFTQTPAGLNPGAVQDASTSVKGIVKMSTAPASATAPIAVGDNDNRVSPVSLATVTSGQVAGFVATTAPSASNLFTTQKDFQKGAEISGSTTGSANAYVFTASPAIAAYTAGMTFRLKANFANTGAATLNVSGLGAIAIKKVDGATALASGDIASGQEFVVVYDGTNFQMVSPTGNVIPSAPVYKYGQTTKSAADASAAQTIAHGCGKTPSIVEIFCTLSQAGGSAGSVNQWYAKSEYNGSTQTSESSYITGNFSFTQDTTFTLNGSLTTGTTVGVVTLDATNITITWTKTGSPTGTYQLFWKATA